MKESLAQAVVKPDSQNPAVLRKVSWVIENITKEPSLTELAKAVREFGSGLFEITGDYTAETISSVAAFTSGRPVLFDGSLNMAELMRRDVPSLRAIVTPANQDSSGKHGL